jgi:formylglycine-generating enzyme required for sulfatase activity
VRLAKVVALQTAAPVLYDLLKEQPGLLRDLENYYSLESDELPSPHPLPLLPDDLTRLIESIPAVKRILTVKHTDPKDTSFGELSPADLRVYFTLTKRAEAPQSASAEPARLLFEPQMIQIPAGKFLMGSTPEQAAIQDAPDKNWAKTEQPQHEVELSAYFIGKYPITNAQYQAFIQDTKYRSPSGWSGENYPPEKSDHPVVNVSWNDAQVYCQWLSQKTGRAYCLPSEAEWEKAARGPSTGSPVPAVPAQAGDGRVYPWGDDFDPTKCNTSESNIGGTTPVGQFSQTGGDSPYGCADMAGNVWEWCQDWFDENEYKNRSGKVVKDPPGPQKGSYRVLRGGSFNNLRHNARCANRYWSLPDYFYNYIGFRVLVAPISTLESES